MDTARSMGRATKVSKAILVTKVTRAKNRARNMKITGQNIPMQKANTAKGIMTQKSTMGIITKEAKATREQSLERKVTSIKVT